MNYKKYTFAVLKAFKSGALSIDVAAKQVKKMLNKWGDELGEQIVKDRTFLAKALSRCPEVALTAQVVVLDGNITRVEFVVGNNQPPSLDDLKTLHKAVSGVIDNYETVAVIKSGETMEFNL